MSMSKRGFRATILHCTRSPYADGKGQAFYEHFTDGLLVVEDGRVKAIGDYALLKPDYPDLVDIVDFQGKWLLPGFVDTHLHYPQMDVMAAYGETLLTWLERYTFPAEGRFHDPDHAARMAELFVQLLLRHGTTCALSFSTTHASSANALFAQAERVGMRMATGKVMMDRNAPDYLIEDADVCFDKCVALIETWHGRGRLSYAITPRFAPTSSPASLRAAARLKERYPDCFMQTHLAENRGECAWVKKLFPELRSYLEVYDDFGLVGTRSIFAHAIHLTREDWETIAARNAKVSFCPSSNLFLGSGLFDLKKALRQQILVALGSDIGGGTSISMLRTIEDAYKVCQLRGHLLSPTQAFYHATLGGAQSLGLEDFVGSLRPGMEADFILLDPGCHPLLSLRMDACAGDLENSLLALFILGGDNAVAGTYLCGRQVYARAKSPCHDPASISR